MPEIGDNYYLPRFRCGLKIARLMAKQIADVRFLPSIRLTPAAESGQIGITIVISQMISYSQEVGFTRLRLTGGKTLDVKETTDRIDHLVRRESSRVGK